jgi:hypothetical protein
VQAILQWLLPDLWLAHMFGCFMASSLFALCWHCRRRLGCSCTRLWQASLAWFPELTLEVRPGRTDVDSLAAWLERHQGEEPAMADLHAREASEAVLLTADKAIVWHTPCCSRMQPACMSSVIQTT